MKTIATIEELHALYGAPAQAALAKVTPRLTANYRRMVEASPFVALATSGPEGLDCSPRGDAGQVVYIENDTTLLLPDWRGNNRVDSLSNIVRDPRLALLFLIPGSSNALRINGRGVVAVEPALLTRFTMQGKHPRSVIIITINEVYFQCARAIMRAGLWDETARVDPATLPTAGQMIQTALPDFNGDAYDQAWPDRAKDSMW